MKKLFLLALLVAMAISTTLAKADTLTPAPPYAVQIAPHGALLHVRHTLTVETTPNNGQPFCTFVLPAGAEAFYFAPSAPVWRTSIKPIELQKTGHMAQTVQSIERRLAEIQGRLAAIKTNISLLENKPTTVTFQDLTQQIHNVQQTLPTLVQEQKQLQKEEQLLKERLDAFEPQAFLGQQVTVALDIDAKAKTNSITLEYGYSLNNCGWQPAYLLEAQPGATREADTIAVRLNADVWQFSGMDWSEAEISLVTQTQGSREPARLPRWTVEAREQSPRERLAAGETAMPMVLAEDTVPAMAKAARSNKASAVTIDEQAFYARFELASKGLTEGRSQIRIANEQWKAPLTWLARPVRGNTNVWLMADCVLPQGKIWPAGKASYYIEGHQVGEGKFAPEGNEVKLFFGSDPRVTLSITGDTKKRGESGFIGKEKNWNWTWTYNIVNRHPRNILVRIERPLPQIVNERITLKHDDLPVAEKDTKKHLLYWNVNIPANGQGSVKHALGISAPADMPVFPVAP